MAPRRYWTDARIISALQEFAEQKERAPVSLDFQGGHRDRPSASTIMRRFGGWKGALAAAGITESNRRDVCDHAYSQLEKAIRNGEMVPLTRCEKCGNAGKINAHHEDYSKPLDVVWLCDSCHTKRHVERKEMGPRRYWSKTQLKVMLQILHHKLEKVPAVSDLRAAYREDPDHFADYNTFRRNFGSWPKALEEAGIESDVVSD